MSGSISQDAINTLEVLQENKYISVRESYGLLDYMRKEGFSEDQSTFYMRKIAYGALSKVTFPVNKILIDIIRKLNDNPDMQLSEMLAKTNRLYPILNVNTRNPLVLYSTELLKQKIDLQLIPLITTILDVCSHFKIIDSNLEFLLNVEEYITLSKYLVFSDDSETCIFDLVLTRYNEMDGKNLLEVTRSDIESLENSISEISIDRAYLRKRKAEVCNKLVAKEAKMLLDVINEEYKNLTNTYDKVLFIEYVASIVFDQSRCKLTMTSNLISLAISKVQEAILQNYTIFSNPDKWKSIANK